MDDTTSTFLETVIAGQIRHVFTYLGGTLVTLGALQSDQSTQFVQIGTGLAMYLVGAGWSWWQKDGQKQVMAQLAKLKHHVDAIPVVPVVPAAEGRPAAAIQVLRVNDAINAAKEVAAATPAEAMALPPPVSLPLGVTRDQRN